MLNTKYKLVEKNEHEILMDELFPKMNKIANNTESNDNNKSVFDYKSINDYNSIFKYRSSNAMMRSNSTLNLETKPLKGFELMFTYAVIGFFYFLVILFLPFSLFFCLKVSLIYYFLNFKKF
jgi:hypothetical protein